jgi:hypothetical protein
VLRNFSTHCPRGVVFCVLLVFLLGACAALLLCVCFGKRTLNAADPLGNLDTQVGVIPSSAHAPLSCCASVLGKGPLSAADPLGDLDTPTVRRGTRSARGTQARRRPPGHRHGYNLYRHMARCDAQSDNLYRHTARCDAQSSAPLITPALNPSANSRHSGSSRVLQLAAKRRGRSEACLRTTRGARAAPHRRRVQVPQRVCGVERSFS